MKFGKNFESHLTFEWREQYMEYSELKSMIYRAIENAPSRTEYSRYQIDAYYQAFQEEFIRQLNNQLTKVNNFFQEKLAESRRRIALLKVQLMNSVKPGMSSSTISLVSATNRPRPYLNPAKPRTLSKLRYLYSEFYLALILLQNYQTLNYTAFQKICKKYDKNFNSSECRKWLLDNVETAPFAADRSLKRMINEIENIYTVYLANGDRSRAMAKLRVPPLGEAAKPAVLFRSGFFLGMFVALIIVVTITLIFHGPATEHFLIFIHLYRAPFSWILFNLFMGLNVAGWQHFGVNHVLILEIDPRDHLQPSHFIEIASVCGILWLLSVLGFLFHKELNVSPFMFPFILIVLWTYLFFNPIPIIHFKSRLWLLCLTGRVITAPFHYVGFADFWLGDQLNSLTTLMSDFWLIIRFYLLCGFNGKVDTICSSDDYASVVAVSLAAWWRFAQCLRRFRDSGSKSPSYLVNAGKYASSFFVVGFYTVMQRTQDNYKNPYDNPYVWAFLISALVSTLYCLFWDFLRDFGLFSIWTGRKIFLRENLVYPTLFYHFVIIENILIRFIWILKFLAINHQTMSLYIAVSVSSTLEIFRRHIWNYVRLENEHLNNCGRFRATRDIFLPTLDVNEERLLQRMMDHDNNKDRSGDRRVKLQKEYF